MKLISLAATLAMAAAIPSWAQTYPTKAVTMINPYPAGGGLDVMARIVAQELSTLWKQPVLIEAKPGAGTTISATYVARAPADGYTLLLSTTQHAVAPALYKNLSYDYLKSFAPITTIAESTFILVTRSDLKVDTVRELMAMMKQKGSAMNWASTGPASIPHLGGAWFDMMTGTHGTHVPFQGTAPALAAILGGQVDYLFADVSAVPQVRAGKVKGLAVTTPKRVSALPNLPTMSETLPGFVLAVWVGIEAPAGTPRAVIDRVNSSVQTVSKHDIVAKRMADVASEPSWMSPEDFAAYRKSEVEKYAKLVKESGAKLE
jgi:tripartite-type tricarboxylate transporter receptor subunit TctC